MSFEWSVCYKRAILKDGTALFPEKLPLDFLHNQRKVQGSYVFANQYMNEIIPLEDQTFKEEWKKYWRDLPPILYTFAFVDPAISEADTADFTAIVVVSVDQNKNWYVRQATRLKCNPSVTIDFLFKLQAQYNCVTIGVEDVAYQKALIHFTFEEMKRRGVMLPITGVKRGPDLSKEMRILSLVPRFEFNLLFLNQGLDALELELSQFPRAAHDDLLDALASINDIVYYPSPRRARDEKPHPQSPEYESWVIRNAHKSGSNE
jgi:predicted phage terminase large subunit-like protein